MTILIKDLYDNHDTLFVLQTETTTADEIEKIIEDVKCEYPGDYVWENVEKRLPADVKVEDLRTIYF